MVLGPSLPLQGNAESTTTAPPHATPTRQPSSISSLRDALLKLCCCSSAQHSASGTTLHDLDTLITHYSMQNVFDQFLAIADQQDAALMHANHANTLILLKAFLLQFAHSHIPHQHLIQFYLTPLLLRFHTACTRFSLHQHQSSAHTSAAVHARTPQSQIPSRYVLCIAELLRTIPTNQQNALLFKQLLLDTRIKNAPPHFKLLLLQNAFPQLFPFFAPQEIQTLIYQSLETRNHEPLKFLVFLIEQAEADDENQRLSHMQHSSSSINQLIYNSVSRIISQLGHNLTQQQSNNLLSHRFIQLSFELLNEFAPNAPVQQENDQFILSMLQLVLNYCTQPSLSVDLRGNALNCLLGNLIHYHSDLALKSGITRSAIVTCAQFMSQDDIEAFDIGKELLKSSMDHFAEQPSTLELFIGVVNEALGSSSSPSNAKIAALEILGITISCSSFFSQLSPHKSSILQLIQPYLSHTDRGIRNWALKCLCKAVRVTYDSVTFQSQLSSFVDHMLQALLDHSSQQELRLSILEALQELDLKQAYTTSNTASGVRESLCTKVILHLIRYYDFVAARHQQLLQCKIVICLSHIIARNASDSPFQWDGCFDQIISFFLRIMQSSQSSKYSNLIKKYSTECIGLLCKYSSQDLFGKYIVQIIAEYVVLLKDRSITNNEMLESIYCFLADICAQAKSSMIQHLPCIFTSLNTILNIDTEERIFIKRMKCSLHSRLRERCEGLRLFEQILKHLPFRVLDHYWKSMLHSLLNLVNLLGRVPGNDSVLVQTFKCVTESYIVACSNPHRITGKKRRQSDSDTAVNNTEPPNKKRRTENQPMAVYQALQMDSLENGSGLGSNIGPWKMSLIVLVRTLDHLLSTECIGARGKISILEELQRVRVYLDRDQHTELRDTIFKSLNNFICSGGISQFEAREQVEICAKLVDICHRPGINETLSEELGKLCLQVMTMSMMMKTMNRDPSTSQLNNGWDQDESFMGIEEDDVFGNSQDVKTIHGFIMWKESSL